MDQKSHEVEQTAVNSQHESILPVADKSCSGSSTPMKKLEIGGSQNPDANFVSPTPEKTDETLKLRSKVEDSKLPEKYRTLLEFFDRMTCSLRLLNLRKQLPTFQNICRQVETLTGRKFSYGHLAQIKFILPEAIQTDKMLIHNKKTSCMEPVIKVSLLFDVIQGHTEPSAYTALCHTFSSRLFKFISTHSEGCEIPEAELPEPFNQRTISISANMVTVDSSTETLPTIREAEHLNSSHLHPSFRRHFSRKDVMETKKMELSPSSVSPSSITRDCTINEDAVSGSCLDPVKQDNSLHAASGDTPVKLALQPDALIIETPALSTPKRSVPSEDKKLNSMISQKVIASNMSAKRSLNFSNEEGQESFLETKSALVEETSTCASVPLREAEESCCTSKNVAIGPGGLRARQDIFGCLSDLVPIIHNIFQSAPCSSITKNELVHKILVNSFDVVESGEVEEQIKLLEEKVPEWISRKVAPTGDLLYKINQVSDLNSICEKLL